MGRRIIFGFIAILFISYLYINSTQHNEGKDKVAILQVIEHPALNITRQGLEDYLKQCCDVHILYENAQGNSNLGIQIGRKFIQEKPKVIVAIGTLAAQVFLKNDDIPVLFSSVTDPVSAGLVRSVERVGGHFSGVSNMTPVLPQLEFFRLIYPNLNKVGVIYNAGEANSVKLVALLKVAAAQLGIEVIESSSRSVSDVVVAAQTLAQNVDAIFITNDNTALSSLGGIIKAADKYSIPVFCSDNDTIGTGVLATFGPNQYEIGKQTGVMVEKILNGVKIEDLPVVFPNRLEKKIDMSVAKKLGISIEDQVLEGVNKVVGR